MLLIFQLIQGSWVVSQSRFLWNKIPCYARTKVTVWMIPLHIEDSLANCFISPSYIRLDVSYSVQVLSRFMDKPSKTHLTAAHKVLRYIKSASGQSLLLSASSNLELIAYCDSDWASCLETRRPVTGYCVLLGQSLISWKSKKQSIVSRSSAEAEYGAMAATVSELTQLHFLLTDLHIEHSQTTTLYCDNQPAIHTASNLVFHERAEHIKLDCHLIIDIILEGSIVTIHVPTHLQRADLITKALPSSFLCSHLLKLGIVNLHSSSCGGYYGT